MDNFLTSNRLPDQSDTGIKTSSNVLKASVVALGIILSSNQVPTIDSHITSTISQDTYIDGTFSTKGVHNIRYSYAERYKQIAKTSWFQDAYKNRSLGEITGLE